MTTKAPKFAPITGEAALAMRKPRTLLSEDKAREAAMSSIRTGAPWAGVYALVPIGCARRGVEWWSA